MLETKTIIFISIFIVILGVGAYFILSSNKKSGGGGDQPVICKPGDILVDGKCITPSPCGVKPTNPSCSLDDLICDIDTNQWRCTLPCESDKHPLRPIGSCTKNQVKCNDDLYYCPQDPTCNGGSFYENGTCVCDGKKCGQHCEITCADDEHCENGVCVINECKNGGIPQGDKCICPSDDFSGKYCQYSREDNCRGKGKPLTNSSDNFIGCSCDSGFSEPYCCDNSLEPSALNQTCKGESAICDNNKKDDPNGGWAIKTKQCMDTAYDYDKSHHTRWEVGGDNGECVQPICGSDQDPTAYHYTLKCDNGTPKCVKGCPLVPDCGKECKSSYAPGESFTSICVCDDSTGYQPKCVPIQNDNNCGPVPEQLCSSKNPPVCVQCGNGTYLWHCDGYIPTSDTNYRQSLEKCIDTTENIQEHDNPTYFYETITGRPVYPLIDNEKCLTETISPSTTINNFDPSKQSYYSLYDNPPLNLMKDGTLLNKKNVDTNKFVVYNSRKKSDGTYHHLDNLADLIDPTERGDASCVKPLSSSFQCVQYNDDQKNIITTTKVDQHCYNASYGDVDCTRPDAIYVTDETFCRCGTYNSLYDQQTKSYYGDSCQFDDNHTCRGVGAYDNSKQTCICGKGRAGNTCQFDRQHTCKSNGNPKDDGTCVCDVYDSKVQGKVQYKGTHCQYNDNDTCKGQGIVDDNGNCEWVAGNVFPRCAELVDNREKDYKKLACKKTVYPDLFSTNCVANDGKKTEFGCPVIPDATAWTPYVGLACHYPNLDNNSCANGAVLKRFQVPGTNDDDHAYDLCQVDDFSKVINVDKSGITNPVVSGVGLVRQQHTFGDASYSVIPNNGLQNNLSTIQGRFNDVCYFGSGAHDRYQSSLVSPDYDFSKKYPSV